MQTKTFIFELLVEPACLSVKLPPLDEFKMPLTSAIKLSSQNKPDSYISADLELVHLHHL